jgi:hypothetical protein
VSTRLIWNEGGGGRKVILTGIKFCHIWPGVINREEFVLYAISAAINLLTSSRPPL